MNNYRHNLKREWREQSRRWAGLRGGGRGLGGAEGGGFGPAEAEADPVETEKAYR